MNAATSLMNRGLIAHSTDTVATTAVTIAGIAATNENKATKRLCSRAPARAAFRAALSLANSIPIRTINVTTTNPSPSRRIATTFAVGRIDVKPANTRKVAIARTKAAPTAIRPNLPVGPLSSSRVVRLAPDLVVVAVKTPATCPLPDWSNDDRCNVATMLPNYAILAAALAKVWHAPEVEVPNSLAQRVTVETQDFCGFDLVSSGERQRCGDQRRFKIVQHAMVKPDWRDSGAE
jgi:hypothetical protein